MDVKAWTVCVIEPNKFEGQIILDLLRGAGVERVRLFTDANAAADALELMNANIIVASFDMKPDGAAWTRAFRRNPRLASRKAAVFITSAAFSRSIAEQCRLAGANALIGKPLSGKVLLATIRKVLASPRPFVEGEIYIGPCRRAGIVTAGAPKKRRKADDPEPPSAASSLQVAVELLAGAAGRLASDASKREACEAALRRVQAYAVNAADSPLMRACAAFMQQLGGGDAQRPEVARAALEACVNGVVELALTPVAESAKRDAIAETVHEAVAKAAVQRAA